MAFAGLRNIARVDVRIDDGPWTPAELLQGESSLVWTQWSYAAPLDAGNHTVAVRAMDDEGFVQSTESGSLLAGAYPDGTDEIHKVVFVVNESS
jgi:hypothetical protein